MTFVVVGGVFLAAILVWVVAEIVRAFVPSVKRVRVPVRVLEKVPARGALPGEYRELLRLEYLGPDGRTHVVEKLTDERHWIHRTRIGPEFDGQSVWVRVNDPTDIAFTRQGRPVNIIGIVAGVLAICLGGTVLLMVSALTNALGSLP